MENFVGLTDECAVFENDGTFYWYDIIEFRGQKGINYAYPICISHRIDDEVFTWKRETPNQPIPSSIRKLIDTELYCEYCSGCEQWVDEGSMDTIQHDGVWYFLCSNCRRKIEQGVIDELNVEFAKVI